MNKYLCKLFINNWEQTGDPAVRKKYGIVAGIFGLCSNILLFAAKLIAGLISGSIAIIGDSINNLSDSLSSLITLVGFKLASLPEDEDHPYGHARIEYVSGIIVSVLIVVVGVELAKSSIEKTMNPQAITSSWLVICILVGSVLVKLYQASFYRFTGKQISSPTLIATGADSRNDVVSTTVVLLSIFVDKFFHVNLDGPMGILVSVFIIYSGISLIKETSSPLLGEKPDPALVTNIYNMIQEYPGVLGIHDLIIHNYGPGKIFGSVHIEVDCKSDMVEAHDLIDNIEKDISSKLAIVMTAHMDPVDSDDPLVALLLERAKQQALYIEGISDVHDLRVAKGSSHTNIIFDVIRTAECPYSEKQVVEAFKPITYGLDGTFYIVINFDGEYTNII